MGSGGTELTDAELAKVFGGAKNPSWKPPIEAPKPVGTGTKGSNFKPNFDSENKLPYNARNTESLLNKCGDISNSTIPKSNMPNVKFAGKCIEKELICSSTGKPLNVKIVFDQRGFPIFDKYAKFETSISGKLSLMDRSAHMRAVTRNLRQNIESGIVNKNIFTERQLQQIYQRNGKN